MLYHIIKQHLMAAGIAKEWAVIDEVFNPHDDRLLRTNPNTGHLEHLELPTRLSTPQLRGDRLRLFREHLNDDYIIKMMAFDTKEPGIVDTIVENYNVVAIERRNPLSAFLSHLIAFHHWVWNIFDDTKPVYEPFVVPEDEMKQLGTAFSFYYYWRDRMNPQAIVYYEDIATQSAEATLRQVGLYQEGFPTMDSPSRKLLSFEEKTKLIINLQEVVEHFTGILAPYTIDIESNNL